jgi:hypothetical protein
VDQNIPKNKSKIDMVYRKSKMINEEEYLNEKYGVL